MARSGDNAFTGYSNTKLGTTSLPLCNVNGTRVPVQDDDNDPQDEILKLT
jgi:hypothetical protein